MKVPSVICFSFSKILVGGLSLPPYLLSLDSRAGDLGISLEFEMNEI